MAKLVECVPNFSEGVNKEVRGREEELRGGWATPGSGCLGCLDGGATQAAPAAGLCPASSEALLSFPCRKQPLLPSGTSVRSEHPRMGALDVCPFVPVMNVTMEECVTCAHLFGQRLAAELGVPVYLYGAAAREESRRALPAIRAGEYEALPEKLAKPEWAPDFGPPTFVPRWGATVTGARTFLIAYNINLLCTKELAHRIALNLREQGRGADQPGRLKKVQGIGWYLEEENIAQVSTNLLDFETTPLHTVYEEVCREAQALNLPVVGSQLVGLVPKKAMLDAAEFYIKKENLFILEEEQKIRLVVNRLGLDSLSPFHPRERIIDQSCSSAWCLSLPPTPGLGGVLLPAPCPQLVSASIAAGCCAGAGWSLPPCAHGCGGVVVGGSRSLRQAAGGGFVAKHERGCIKSSILPPAPSPAQISRCAAEPGVGHLSVEALKLPKNTPAERERRLAAMQQGLKTAMRVPCALAEKVSGLWPALQELARHCNLACKSDIQVGAKMLEAAAFGAYFNVMINLKDIDDGKFKQAVS
ncbi:FTCD cyclodeaminase, partial [Zapornia atra]|nr:FTCD cyclodeaminase [Zapornia atra]